jgi:hypothetical protein
MGEHVPTKMLLAARKIRSRENTIRDIVFPVILASGGWNAAG